MLRPVRSYILAIFWYSLGPSVSHNTLMKMIISLLFGTSVLHKGPRPFYSIPSENKAMTWIAMAQWKCTFPSSVVVIVFLLIALFGSFVGTISFLILPVAAECDMPWQVLFIRRRYTVMLFANNHLCNHYSLLCIFPELILFTTRPQRVNRLSMLKQSLKTF